MATAGRQTLVSADATGTFSADITGVTAVNLDIDPGLIETQDFNDTWKTRIQGLKDLTGSLELLWDDTAHAVFQNNVISGTALYIRILLDGTNGFSFKAESSLSFGSTTTDGLTATVNFSIAQPDGTGPTVI